MVTLPQPVHRISRHRQQLPALLLEMAGSPAVVAFTIDSGRITAIDIARNPEKLTTLAHFTIEGPGGERDR